MTEAKGSLLRFTTAVEVANFRAMMAWGLEESMIFINAFSVSSTSFHTGA